MKNFRGFALISFIPAVLFVTVPSVTFAQYTMHNFTVTDSDGNTHNLYTSHLDQGKTVVIKFFFTTCPPCIALAPWWQQRNVAWGNNQHDTRFFEVTILGSDNNVKVANYKNTYGLTVIGVGSDGGSASVVQPFQLGNYGPFWGTPSFAVIAPDRTLHYPVQTSELDAVIASTGAQMPGAGPAPTQVQVNLQTPGGVGIPNNAVKFFLKPLNASTPKIEIPKNANGQYTFTYPSSLYPEMTNPVVIMESVGAAYEPTITAFDLVLIQKHILGLTPFEHAYQTMAADVDGNDKVTAADLVVIRKLILGLIDEFPNGVPSYKSIPAFQPVTPNPGQSTAINMIVFKMGNVN